MNKIKHYAVTLDSDVYAISLVDEPAIEKDFVFLSKEKELQVFLEKDEKHLVLGPVLIPNKPIYRNNGKEEYFIEFSKETIEKLAYEYLMNGRMYSVTTQHEEIADDICLVESWIKTSENDKSKDYGIDVPVGTWLCSMKVENEDVWQRVKSGELRGFSIESFVNLDEINFKKQNTDMTEQIELNSTFWEKLSSIIKEALNINSEVKSDDLSDVKEETVEMSAEEEKVEEIALEEATEEVTEPTEEEVAEIIAEQVVEEVESVVETEEEKESELQAIIDKLTEEINNKDAEIAEMKKQIEKMSKQPSTEPIKVDASAQRNHPSFLDFASGRVKL